MNITNNHILEDTSNRIFDYFAICGLPQCLSTHQRPQQSHEQSEESTTISSNNDENRRLHDSLLLKNSNIGESCLHSPSSPSSPPHTGGWTSHENSSTSRRSGGAGGLDPIVDIGVINKTANETVPPGYECLWLTASGHNGNLCGSNDTGVVGSLLTRSSGGTQHMFLVYRRGRDRPPITDIGVFYEGSKEQVMDGCTVVKTTCSGTSSANLNTSTFLNVERIFVTYRRAPTLACNSLAVVDICVIRKGETAPHSFNIIHKSLNRSLLGTSVYICYKKSWIPAPQIKYTPNVLYKYPAVEHADLPFPNEVAFFGLPMGAVIELWPGSSDSSSSAAASSSSSSSNSTYLNDLEPMFNTFVLNVNSDDGVIMEKVYGACIIFYERFNAANLSRHQLSLLLAASKYKSSSSGGGGDDGDATLKTNNDKTQLNVHSNKCLLILSRNPLFDTYRSFLYFLLRKYTVKFNAAASFLSTSSFLPIERYLHYMIYEVPFPSYPKPRVLVNLTENEEDYLTINLPNDTLLPQSGASFIELVHNLGVENSINTLLFVLLQRNVMMHSLRKQVLTGVVEAITCIIFPFIWRYSYIPMCPLVFCELIEAPGSFIIGMDTRYFDLFDPPQNVICIDLDTNTISDTPDRQHISLDMLPRKALNALKAKLGQIETEIRDLNTTYRTANGGHQLNRAEFEVRLKRKRRLLDLAVREAFLKFMASLLQNYKAFQRTVTRRPDVKAIDRNLAKFFDCDGFIRSKEPHCQRFYQELTRTQLFYDCIMNLSFTSELEPSLADAFYFFAEVCSKMNIVQSPQSPNGGAGDDGLRLLELNECENTQTVVVLPPSETNIDNSISVESSAFCYEPELCKTSFPPVNPSSSSSLGTAVDGSVKAGHDNQSNVINPASSSLAVDVVDTSPATATTTAADSQSVSSSTTTNNRRVNTPKVPAATPVNVRTKAERMQALRKLEMKLNIRTSNTNAKHQAEKKNAIAKIRAYSLLSNSYALWFIYLPEYIKDCDDAKKNALNYAYHVLLQMQRHSLTQPDEICYRVMMHLCHIYNAPTLAVKILLHMHKYKINISPMTLSFYNKAIIETSSWPSLQQDRWARVRLTWLVVCRFRQNLKIKEMKLRRERKLQQQLQQRQQLKKRQPPPRKKSITSGNGRRKSSLQPPVPPLQPLIPPIAITGLTRFDLVDNSVDIRQDLFDVSSKKAQTKSSLNTDKINSDKIAETLTRRLNMLHIIQYDLNDGDLHFANSGILILSEKQYSRWKNLPVTASSKAHQNMTEIKKLKVALAANRKKSLSYSSLNHGVHNNNEKLNVDGAKSKSSVVESDPLGALNTNANNSNANRASRTSTHDHEAAKKRLLFDYKPFSSMDSFNSDLLAAPPKPKSATVTNATAPNSDFIYPKASILVNSETAAAAAKKATDSGSNVSRSIDYNDEDDGDEDEMYDEENEYDESDENDEDEEDDMSDYECSNYEENERGGDGGSVDENKSMSMDLERQSLPVGLDEEEEMNAFKPPTSAFGSVSGGGGGANNRASATMVSTTTTMFISPFQTRFKSLIKSVGTSFESNRHLRDVKEFITDKSVQIKEVILSNSQHDQDISAKLKSLSNYQIRTPQHYLNGLVKSSSQAVGLSSTPVPRSVGNESSSSPSTTSTKKTTSDHLDLEPLSSSDDQHFSHLGLDWWGLNSNRLYCASHVNVESAEAAASSNDILVDVQMNSCNYCDKCNSYLYDEEIMSGWTLNESDLNIKCLNCSHPLVPKLYIKIQDYDNIRKYLSQSVVEQKQPPPPDTKTTNEQHPFLEDAVENNTTTPKSPKKSHRLSQLKIGSSEFTVQYLSPFVLRKEFENIILMSKSGADDPCLIDAAFISEHEVIFWNLLWYFKRVGVDSGHLTTVLLNTRLNELRVKLAASNEEADADVDVNVTSQHKFVFRNFIPSLQANKPYGQHPHVLVKCMWDNLKLKEENVNHEVPLYLSWLLLNYAEFVALKSKLITVLSLSELRSFRKSGANSRTLSKIYEQVIRNIKESDVLVPLRSLIRERIRSKMNFSSIYREILFLIIVALERDLIDIDAFDTEYRDAYKQLIQSDVRDFVRPCDKPPNNLAVWSRRLFSPLLL